MKKNYKAALLRAQMGGRLPKAQNLNIEGFSPAQSTCPTCPGYVDPGTDISADPYRGRRGPRPGWTDNSLPCRGKICPNNQILDPGTCECITVDTVKQKDRFTDCNPPADGCPTGTVWNPPACDCVMERKYPGMVDPRLTFKEGGQYSPNMNKALKSFKKGGSTKK